MVNKIQQAYEALKQAIKEEGFEPCVTVWIHNHRNPHMSVEKAKELLNGYEINVDKRLFKANDIHLVEYVDDTGGFRITANLTPIPKEKHEWLMLD